METIVNPKQSINRIWGKQIVQESIVYRLMKYVLIVDHEDKRLLQNFVTGQLVVLNEVEAQVINNLPSTYSPVMEQLVTDHYLVPVQFDEYKSVNQLRKILQIVPSDNAINHYVILPTTYCNAHCFYCYESDYPHVQMTEETAQEIIEFIDQHREGKNISINWFGGEPLVGVNRIDQISQGLKDRNISFTSSMISNGYLFDDDVVDKCKNLWNLQRVQITLDGTENVYNQVKSYVNVHDSPFKRVIRNIDLLSSRSIQVNVRLNVDFYNIDDIRELIEFLGKRYSDNKYVGVYLSMLFNDQGFEPVTHTADERLALADLIDELENHLKQFKLYFDSHGHLCMTISHCMADNPHTILIQPDGSFCRCEHESILDNYGNLKDGIINLNKPEKWKEADEPSASCPECPIYPSCYHLKLCMNSDLPCIDKLQKRNISRQKERILALYIHKKEEKVDEGV